PCRHAAARGVQLVGQSLAEPVEAAQEALHLGPGGVAQLDEPLELLRGVAAAAVDGLRGRDADLLGSPTGPSEDALRLLVGGGHQLRGLVAMPDADPARAGRSRRALRSAGP